MAANDAQSTPAAAADLPPISDLTYEQARDELISIVARLEGGQIGLEDSMALWERGEALYRAVAQGSPGAAVAPLAFPAPPTGPRVTGRT